MFNVKSTVRFIPQSNSSFVWEKFFKNLMTQDPKAPLLVMLSYFSILKDVEIPAGYDVVYYYDVAIEVASDDRYPAYEAAEATGFLEEGIAQIVQTAFKDPVGRGGLAEAVKVIFDTDRWIEVSQKIQDQAKTVLDYKENVGIKLVDDISWWKDYFCNEMMTNANTPTSILSYYLETVLGQPCTIFCPLGWDEYERAGKEMASNDAILDAAIETGLMTEAVATYFGAALDNDINWDQMRVGVEHLLNSPKLRCHIPFRERYVAEKMLQWTTGHEVAEDEWYAKYREIQRDFSDAEHGYVD